MASSFPTREQPVFKRLSVDAHFNLVTHRRVLVEWALDKAFVAGVEGPYKFTLYRGYAANDDDFQPIAETFDQPWLYDNDPVFPQHGMDVFYKVTLTANGGHIYTSQAVHATTSWNRYDWTIAKEIIRKEWLLLRKRAGTAGWLLKRRLWGDPCSNPNCQDETTGQSFDPNCPSCYGTGVEGGFYDPIEYWVLMNPSQRIKKLDTNLGLVTSTVETVRALAYPAPATNDIWINDNTDQRYLILGDIVAAVRHRGINLVLNLRLEEEPKSSSIYNFPQPCVSQAQRQEGPVYGY